MAPTTFDATSTDSLAQSSTFIAPTSPTYSFGPKPTVAAMPTPSSTSALLTQLGGWNSGIGGLSTPWRSS